MKYLVVLFLSFLALLSGHSATGALPGVDSMLPDETYNPNSLHPIPHSNILMKKRLWRHIDLKEKYNRPLSPYRKELPKLIIEGVKKGALTPYRDEEFQETISKEEFLENLVVPNAGATDDRDEFEAVADWGDEPKKKKAPARKVKEYFTPSEISVLEIMEDWLFDKVRSVQVYDIQSIKLIIPADKFDTGLHRELGVFKYKELAPYLDKCEADWLNVKNSAGNIKITDALSLRLFSSRIYKIENPSDHTVADLYNSSPKAAALAAQELEEKLLEEEFFLWQP